MEGTMNTHVHSGIIALGLLSLLSLPAESAPKKQMTTKQVVCLALPGGVLFAVIGAASKKPAFCILNGMRKSK